MTGERGEAAFPEPRTSHAALRRALESPRYELVPTEGARGLAVHLPRGAEVAVTCSPALGLERTLELARALSERGFRAVPHLAARQVEGEEHLRAVLRRLEDGGVRDVFVVGGDARRAAGTYPDGLALLRAMDRLGYRLETVGVPAYPEGHPFIREEELTRALLEKEAYASYMVTQLCFDPGEILAWLWGIRERGGSLPVYVGVPGAVERGRLLGISLKIGVGGSLRYLSKQHGLVGHLLARREYAPDDLVEALAPRLGDPRYGIAGFHLNTFNAVEATERWRLGRLAALDEEGRRA